MNKQLKLGIFTLLIAGAVTFAVTDLFSHGWGRGYGHMGPGYGYGHMMGPGYMRDFGPEGYDNFKSDLGLSEKQIEKIHRINSRYRETIFQNRNNPDKIFSLRKEQRKEIDKVLTKKQKERFYGSRGYGKDGWFRGCGW